MKMFHMHHTVVDALRSSRLVDKPPFIINRQVVSYALSTCRHFVLMSDFCIKTHYALFNVIASLYIRQRKISTTTRCVFLDLAIAVDVMRRSEAFREITLIYLVLKETPFTPFSNNCIITHPCSIVARLRCQL